MVHNAEEYNRSNADLYGNSIGFLEALLLSALLHMHNREADDSVIRNIDIARNFFEMTVFCVKSSQATHLKDINKRWRIFPNWVSLALSKWGVRNYIARVQQYSTVTISKIGGRPKFSLSRRSMCALLLGQEPK